MNCKLCDYTEKEIKQMNEEQIRDKICPYFTPLKDWVFIGIDQPIRTNFSEEQKDILNYVCLHRDSESMLCNHIEE